MGIGKRGKFRQALYEAQAGRCSLCGQGLGALGERGEWRPTFEHVWPRSRYSYADRGNLLLAHFRCNIAKGTRDPTGCEVILLAAVNARLGLALVGRLEHQRNNPPPTREQRRAQSERDKARDAAKWPREPGRRPVPTKAELERRPACLGLLDDAVEALRTCRDGPNLGL